MQQPQGEPPKAFNSTSLNKPSGLIYPPAEIRKIADKTAEFVAKNGPSFEELVIKAEANNIKFSFLKADDPYRAYYDFKVSEFLQSIEATQQPVRTTPVVQQVESSSTGNTTAFTKTSQTVNPIVISQTSSFLSSYQMTGRPDFKKEVKPPMPDQYSVEHPLNVTLLDLDIIKHTAQFVAKNGQKFLIALTEREKQNPQFEFLKPNHALFPFFTNLVDAYSKCIMPKKEELQKLQINVQDRMAILNRAGERFEFENMQKQVKKKKEEIDEEERIQMAQIDWNDFIVVETIDLFENEELPAPLYFDKPEKPEEKEKPQPQPRQAVEIEERKPLNKPAPPVELLPQQEQLVPLPLENDLKVRKNYIRKSGNSDNATVKCEVCGHNIPVNEYNEHLRIELMDPKHQQMKNDLNQRTQNTATATGEELSANLQMFSKKRPDIFGTVEEQFNANEKKKPEKILWDGHSNTMTRTTANVAMLQQQTKKNIEESLNLKPSEKMSAPINKPPPQIHNPLPNPPANSLNKTLLEDVKTTIPSNEEKNKNISQNFEKISHNIPSFTEQKEMIPTQNVNVNLGQQNTPNHPMPTINTTPVSNINIQPLTPQVPVVGMMKPPLLPLLMDSSRMIKEENINLIPEEKWLELNPNHIQINIKIPDNGGEEPWSFNGQVVQLEVDPRTTIGNIKDILSGILGGMPTQKQKLKSNLFSVLKDNHSLAYYNMINGLVLELSVKERGGRARNK